MTQAGSTKAAAGDAEKDVVFRQGLVITSVGRFGRNPFHIDPIEALIVKGQWTPPAAGDVISGPDGTDWTWKVATASADCAFTSSADQSSPDRRRGGGAYLYVPFNAPAGGIQILEAAGHDAVYVNGEPRVGDPYENGILQLPVKLRAGTNDFLFQYSRGSVKAKLVTPKSPALLNMRDLTLPDLLRGDKTDTWGAVVAVNCTTNFLNDLSLRASCGGRRAVRTALSAIPPLSSRKVGLRIQPYEPAGTNVVAIKLDLVRNQSRRAALLDSQSTSLRLRRPDEHYKQTFRSDIDGSVQYFAVPRRSRWPRIRRHGRCFFRRTARPWRLWDRRVVMCRRPGAQWSHRQIAARMASIGRIGAGMMPWRVSRCAGEVEDRSAPDLSDRALDGRTWRVAPGRDLPGSLCRDCAERGGLDQLSCPTPDGAQNQRGPGTETLAARHNSRENARPFRNYLHQGIYILHGADDDNVPVTEARTMRDHLSHIPPRLHLSRATRRGTLVGNQCMDWPPIFDLFARHRSPTMRVFPILISPRRTRASRPPRTGCQLKPSNMPWQ